VTEDEVIKRGTGEPAQKTLPSNDTTIELQLFQDTYLLLKWAFHSSNYFRFPSKGVP
jgi:hypothetical protein